MVLMPRRKSDPSGRELIVDSPVSEEGEGGSRELEQKKVKKWQGYFLLNPLLTVSFPRERRGPISTT